MPTEYIPPVGSASLDLGLHETAPINVLTGAAMTGGVAMSASFAVRRQVPVAPVSQDTSAASVSGRVRQLVVAQGDSLRGIAVRELNDPERWVEIARLNGLRPPFIVESIRPADRLSGTAIWGDTILTPWAGNAARDPTPTSTFGADLALVHGDLAVSSGGDLATLAAADNVVQALGNRLRTLRGELLYHAEYGSHVGLAVGLPAGPFASLMAASWTHEALAAEPRVANVRSVDARVDGDALRVAAVVETVRDNTPVDINLVLSQ